MDIKIILFGLMFFLVLAMPSYATWSERASLTIENNYVGTSLISGITTNYSNDIDTSYFFMSKLKVGDTDSIVRFNYTNDIDITWINLPSSHQPQGLYTNSSGSPVTDFWYLDIEAGSKKLMHRNLSDQIESCELLLDPIYGDMIDSNETSTGMVNNLYYTYRNASGLYIVNINSTCNQLGIIDLATLGFNNRSFGLSVTPIDAPVEYFWVFDNANQTLNKINTTPGIEESWNFSTLLDLNDTNDGSTARIVYGIDISNNINNLFLNYLNDTDDGESNRDTIFYHFTNVGAITSNYTTPVIETETTNFNATLNTNPTPTVSDVEAILVWNSTEYDYDTKTQDGRNFSFYKDINIPLVNSNETNISFYWSFNVTYSDSSTAIINSSSNDQTIIYGYYWSDPLGNITVGFEDDAFRFNSTLTSLGTGGSLFNKSAIFNNTIYTPTVDGTLHYRDIFLPIVYTATTINFTFATDITYGDVTKTRSSEIGNVTVNQISFNNTTASGFCEVARFDYWNEESPTEELNASMEMTLRTWGSDPDSYKEFSFTYATNHSHYLYINPCNASRYVYSIQDYSNLTDYPERHYFMQNVLLNNTSQTFNLYLLNSTYADVIGFTVNDILNKGVRNIIIEVQRFYTGENVYRIVAMGITDSDGNTPIRLRKSTGDDDVWYRFLLYRNYILVKTFPNTHIIEDITLSLDVDSLAEYWEYYDKIAVNCNYNEESRLLLCEYQDTSGLLLQANLYVKQIEIVGYTEICNETSTSSDDSLSCDLSGEDADGTFEWWLEFTYPETKYTVAKGMIEPSPSDIYSESGIFAGFLLFLALVGVGAWRREAMLVFGIFGLIIAFWLNLAPIGIAGLVAIIICIILFMIKMGDDR